MADMSNAVWNMLWAFSVEFSYLNEYFPVNLRSNESKCYE